MMPLDPTVAAELAYLASDDQYLPDDYNTARLGALVDAGLATTWQERTDHSPGFWCITTWWQPTEEGSRALRVHAAYLATVGS